MFDSCSSPSLVALFKSDHYESGKPLLFPSACATHVHVHILSSFEHVMPLALVDKNYVSSAQLFWPKYKLKPTTRTYALILIAHLSITLKNPKDLQNIQKRNKHSSLYVIYFISITLVRTKPSNIRTAHHALDLHQLHCKDQQLANILSVLASI